MAEKGILTNEQEKAIAKAIDEAIKLKGIPELVDGYAAKAIITLVDDSLIEKINLKPELKEQIGLLVDAAIAENVPLAEEIGSNIINTLVDVPGIDEDAEAVLFEGAVKIIVAAIITKLCKKSAQD